MSKFVIFKTFLVLLLFFYVVYRSQSTRNNNRLTLFALWACSILIILSLTVLRSPTLTEKTAIIVPFKSYYSIFISNWVAHGKYVLRANIANVIMFFPIGSLVFYTFKNFNNNKRLIILFTINVFLTLSIELIQYNTLIGTFEIDDVMHNVLGGYLGYLVIKKIDECDRVIRIEFQ